MLLLIIFGIMIVIGIVAVILYNCGPDWAIYETWVMTVAIIGIALGLVALICSGIATLSNYFYWPEDVMRLQAEYLAITEDLERLNDTDGLLHVWTIKDSIIEYNTEVYKHKRFADSPWIGIFYNKEIAAMPLIEIGG